MDNLSLLMVKSSSEVMSSHLQKLVQVYIGNVDCFFLFCFIFAKRDLCVGFGGILVRLWEASRLGEECVHS